MCGGCHALALRGGVRVETVEGLQVLSRIACLLRDELWAAPPVDLSAVRPFDEFGQSVEQGKQVVERAELLDVDVSDGETPLETFKCLGLHGGQR